ncbi:hypothetical protein Tco_1480395 [Tanacetum coccineum]
MAYPLPSDTTYPVLCPIQLRMTKVIKGEFEKIKDVKVEDVPLTCDASLKVFNDKVSRLSKMDDDLFTYEVEVANIPCDSNKDDDSEQRMSHETDDDMGYDPSDVAFTERGDNEVELTDEESSDNEDEVTETYEEYKDDWIYEWNRGIPWVDEKPWNDTRRNDGFCNGGNLPGAYIVGNSLHYQDYEWYEALEDDELKEKALRNKAIMEGFVNEEDDDDESRYERKKRVM